jgi:hypothetical protein
MATTESTSVDDDASVPPSQRVLSAVSAVRGVDVLDLPPLYDAVDPDVIDQLFTNRSGAGGVHTGRVTFEYADCTVVVGGDGTITVQ